MNFLAHEIFGFFLTLMVIGVLGMFPTDPVAIGTTFTLIAVSSIMPDIDHQKSTITKVLLFISTVFVVANFGNPIANFISSALNFDQNLCLIGVFVVSVVLVNVVYILLKPSHRGKVHSLLVGAIYAGAIYLLLGFNLTYGLIALVAFYSHLLLDVFPSMSLNTLKVF